MPSALETVSGLYGAWRLARLDRGAVSFFDATVEGFWKSFFAAVLVAPGYGLIVALELAGRGTDSGALRVLLVHLSAYAISWTAFPLIAHYICEAIGKRDRFIVFIVASNWAKVIQMLAYMPVVFLVAGEALPGGALALINSAVYVLILAYQWFVTRTTLEIQGPAAAGLVALDLVIGMIVNGVAIGMTQ